MAEVPSAKSDQTTFDENKPYYKPILSLLQLGSDSFGRFTIGQVANGLNKQNKEKIEESLKMYEETVDELIENWEEGSGCASDPFYNAYHNLVDHVKMIPQQVDEKMRIECSRFWGGLHGLHERKNLEKEAGALMIAAYNKYNNDVYCFIQAKRQLELMENEIDCIISAKKRVPRNS